MKILIAADLHIGANKFKMTGEKWNRPVEELVNYATYHELDAVAFAGDVFHSRRPSPASQQFMYDQILKLKMNDIAFFGADGNHDDEVRADSVSATWAFVEAAGWYRKKPARFLVGETNLVFLPWTTPQAYGVSASLPLKEQLTLTQAMALTELNSMIVADRKNVLIGHAMVAYGPGQDDLAPSPGLQWAGKDVVFDYGTLSKGFDAVYLGHVHDPRMKGYVGSSQPTDWGDAPQTKSFVVLDTDEMTEIIVPYKTSLKLLDASPATVIGDMGKVHYDVGRYRQHVQADEVEPSVEELAAVRTKMEAICDRVESIEVTKERVVVQRVATDTPLAAMQPEEAADAWIRNASLDGKTATDVKAKFQTLVVQSEK